MRDFKIETNAIRKTPKHFRRDKFRSYECADGKKYDHAGGPEFV